MLRPALLTLALTLPAATMAETPHVVTDIGPVEGLVAMVMQDLGSPDRLLPPGGSPHEMALRPSQARTLSKADLVVWIGPALTPGLGDTIETLAPKARVVALQFAPGTHHLAARDTGLFEHDHGEADHHAHDDEDHDHDDHEQAIDPHLWLDPDNAAHWLSVIAQALSEADPDNAATYRENARTGAEAIHASGTEAARLLSAAADRPLAAGHDAFQYFEAHFGLSLIGALSDSDANASGPARLAALRNTLAETPPACVLTEPGADLRLVRSIAGEAPVAELDALGSTLPQGAALYPALIRDFAERIAACVSE